MNQLLESNEILDDAEQLKARLDQDGYLFFRQLIESEPLLELRREMLDVMNRNGWLVAGSELMEGRSQRGSSMY